MNLESMTHSKSVIASVGIHALMVGIVSGYYYLVAPKSLELTGLAGGNGLTTISLNNVSFISSTPKSNVNQNNVVSRPQEKKPVAEKSRAVVRPDANAKKTESISDEVSEQYSALSAAGQVGEPTGNSGVGTGTGFGIGSGAGDFDGGLLFGKIKRYFEQRLGSSLQINEDQLIKVKLKLSNDGNISSAELIEGKIDVSNLRKILAVARNLPLKSYWQNKYALPGELIIPLFLTSN